MNFQRGQAKEEPEINLVPMIDVLIVIVIFLVVTTTYSRYTELQINLPTAEAEQQKERPNEISVAVDAQGQYRVNKEAVTWSGPEGFSAALKKAAGGQADPIVIITADAAATHQSVVQVMAAARLAGYGRITFTAQAPR